MKIPFLTIGMIVKNEEEVLRRCLDSLRPIMEALPCELLITDTGSTDKTVEIVKEYTDQISFFEWCNDFSAARNVALSQAKGKWFMMFDADQWFDDISAIVNFFKSNEAKKYTSASVISRNYVDANDKEKYSDSAYVIFHKIYKGIKFKGKIHENITVDINSHKSLPVICHHTGYDFTNDAEKKIKKHERNLAPLIAEYEEDPENIRTLDHLIKQYKGVDEMLAAKGYVEKAYNIIKDNPKNLYFSLVYKHMCALKEAQCNWQEVRYFASKYLAERIKADDIDMDFYITMGKSFMKLEKATEAIESFNKYLSLYEACQNGSLMKSTSIIDKAENNISFNYVWTKINLANCYLFNYEENNFIETLNSIEGDEISVDHIDLFISKPLDYGKFSNDFNFVAKLLSRIIIAISDDEDERVAKSINYIESYIIRNPEFFVSMAKAFAQTETEHIYFKLMKLRELDIDEQTNAAKSVLEELIVEDTNKNLFLGELAFYILKFDYNISDFIENIDENNLGIITSNIAKLHNELYEILVSKCETMEASDAALKERLFVGMLLEQIVINGEQLSTKNAINAFNIYVNWMKNLLNNIYNISILDTSMAKILSPGFRFVYYAAEAITAYEAGDKVKYIKLLKEGVVCYPPMGKIIKLVLNNFEIEEKQKPESEFEEYALAVKAKIVELLDMGMRVEVAPLIDAYEKVNPQDPELHVLKGRAGLLN